MTSAAATGASDEPDAEPKAETEVRKIQQLEETVINRIAAGEVVVRPANALKELLENCLDAGSTKIVVALKAGGLKMLRVEDDGHGIREEDLPILCERFTTSKLRKYEDLTSIGTFGFRGEALASISHVAHVTVTTMTAKDSVARVASYTDGKLRGPPRPCAGTKGTTIVAEDMFYNNQTRRQALGKDAVEHAKVLEVVQKYAMHYPKVSFTCRKASGAIADLHTSGGAQSTTRQVASAIYGSTLASNLFEFEVDSEDPRFRCRGLATGPQWTARSLTLTVFINNRLVECAALRRAVDSVFSQVLPRHQHPWAFIALDLDPATVDVNVHPTKMEVQFLHEEAISERIQDAIAPQLKARAGMRTFDSQGSLLASTQRQQQLAAAKPAPPPEPPGLEAASVAMNSAGASVTAAISIEELGAFAAGGSLPLPTLPVACEVPETSPAAAQPKGAQGPKRVDPNPTRVRTDHLQRSLESVWRESKASTAPQPSTSAAASPPAGAAGAGAAGEALAGGAPTAPATSIPPAPAETSAPFGEDQAQRDAAFREAQQLTSVAQLRTASVLASADADFARSLNQSVYVGPIDRELVILQCGPALCLANLAILGREFAYQRLLRLFGGPGRITLRHPLPLRELLSLGVQDPGSGYEHVNKDYPDPEVLAAQFSSCLEGKAELLHEYFMMDIAEGKLWSLPNALGVTSDVGLKFDGLPLFLLRLCTEVDWDEEKPCLEGLCRVIGDFCVEALLPTAEEANSVLASSAGASAAAADVQALNAAVAAGEFSDVVEAAAAAKAKRSRTVGPNALQELRYLHEAMRNDAASVGAASACRWPGVFQKDNTVLKLVSLEQLYRIFERC